MGILFYPPEKLVNVSDPLMLTSAMHTLIGVDADTKCIKSFLARALYPLQDLAKDQVPAWVQSDLQDLRPLFFTVIHSAPCAALR